MPETTYISNKLKKGAWKLERVPALIVGLKRPIEVYRAVRQTDFITHGWFGDRETFCPPLWWDLAIGSGACGLGCRACFLMLTFRSMRDPSRHVLYSNVDDFWRTASAWLRASDRKPHHTLGLGIDRSDSLLYEGLTGHARELVPMFANSSTNPNGCYLILLTKSTNVQYLPSLGNQKAPVAITFSVNPEPTADLWEGKYADTGERITPPIEKRLRACVEAQERGYETRWRVDPILTPDGWEELYEDFFAQAAALGARPHFVTLGTYREKSKQLDYWRQFWELPSMEWSPKSLEHDGTHRHVETVSRNRVYKGIAQMIGRFLPGSFVTLCRETYSVREASGLCGSECVCLKGTPRSDVALVRIGDGRA